MVIWVDFLYDSALFGSVIHHDPCKLHLGSLEEKTSEDIKISSPPCFFGFIKIVDGHPSFHPSFTFPGVAAGLAKVQAGAEIDHGPVTPLHLAARHGHLDACKASFFFSCSDGSIGRVEPVDGSKNPEKTSGYGS